MQHLDELTSRLIVRCKLSTSDVVHIRSIYEDSFAIKSDDRETTLICHPLQSNIIAQFIANYKSVCVAIIDKTDSGSSSAELVYPNSLKISSEYNLQKTEKFGIFLLELLSGPSQRDAVIGDILEARDDVRDRHGERKAKIYFWWQVTRSVLHFTISAIKRLRWIAAALGFFGWVARQFSS